MSFRPALPTTLAPREWSVLKYCWRRGGFTTRDIVRDLADDGDPLSRSAVLTLLQRTVTKGYLGRVPNAANQRTAYTVLIPYEVAIQREISAFFRFLDDEPVALRLVRDELARRSP